MWGGGDGANITSRIGMVSTNPFDHDNNNDVCGGIVMDEWEVVQG
jgi:hypothetical protein